MTQHRRKVCPYLGLARDASTHMGFPSMENLCFHADPRVSPGLSHQLSFCLRPIHEECSSYIESSTQPPQYAPVRRVSMSILFLLLFAVAAGMFWSFRSGMKDAQRQPSARPVGATIPGIPSDSLWTFAAAPQSETDVSATSFTTAVSESSSPVPALSEPSTSTPHLHGYEVVKKPREGEQGYLVHLVAYGETLDMIAARFETTIEAIMRVNYKLEPPVWADYPIVVPVGAQDAAGLQSFEVYVVQDYDVLPAESLAILLGVDVNLLEYYNLCSENCQFDKGDVLLIQREQ